MSMPDSYIVRIYRRNKKNPRLIAGIVEQVGEEGWKAGFENAEDLHEILGGVKATNRQSGLGSDPKRTV